MPGAPLPPSRQPNVSRTSLHVAARVLAGRSAKPVPHTCSANAQAGSLIGAISFRRLPQRSARACPQVSLQVQKEGGRARFAILLTTRPEAHSVCGTRVEIAEG